MKRALVLMIALSASPALAAEQQFDLICKAPGASERYRIDLARGEWCFGECKLVQKLAEVTSGTIFLRKQDPSGARGPENINRIDRSTGEWYWFSYDPVIDRVPDVTKGHCEPSSFSGFPAAKF